LDLNQRPLGYEGKFDHHSNQNAPTLANDDDDLLNRVVGAFWLISVGSLHSRFIGTRPRSAEGCRPTAWTRRQMPTSIRITLRITNDVAHAAGDHCDLSSSVTLGSSRWRAAKA
jgi:hypothetical protein